MISCFRGLARIDRRTRASKCPDEGCSEQDAGQNQGAAERPAEPIGKRRRGKNRLQAEADAKAGQIDERWRGNYARDVALLIHLNIVWRAT